MYPCYTGHIVTPLCFMILVPNSTPPYYARVCELLVLVAFSLPATYSNYDVHPGMIRHDIVSVI